MVRIAPSILSADFMRLGDEIKAAEAAGADMLHLDIMDGHFVPNITIGPGVVEAVRKVTSLPLDVHLMIENPDKFVGDFVKAGADYITVHAEASVHMHRTVQLIKENGVKAGVSINPATPLWSLDDILADLDMALLMSVNPGFGGQAFIPFVLDKVKALKGIIKEKGLNVLIEVDGGVKTDNAKEVASAGADILVMGSAFFNSEDYGVLMKKLRGLLGE
ncbi:MAG: ribulose-phosphate 3-epimerase [Nitrospirae bacterium GWC2_46_6]|nr:MAG: ribulose-phosphate 3-epimerase [Nitrospirae bacterium GWC2_46_6]OGW20756.1 MAG: ribulose-phosphate 3-epimerase [Nitrospirae bacterium GWA2_46_11]HCZ11039.1 ribulose-phosphate 3-epimerase [Nitrospiraceae bacterium]